MARSNSFYKNNDTDQIYWVDNPDNIGLHEFSFDRKKIFMLFRDYPHALTSEQREIFDRENPEWAKFFADR